MQISIYMFQCYMHSFPQISLLTHTEILPKENGVFLNVCNAELFANVKKKMYFKKETLSLVQHIMSSVMKLLEREAKITSCDRF